MATKPVRKRDRYTRFRDRGKRPKTPAPKTGWVAAELARICQVPVRRLRYYVERKLIEPSEFRGTATRYQRRELLRLLGIGRLRSETRQNLAQIKRELNARNERELETWLRTASLPPEVITALDHSAPATVTDLPDAGLRDVTQLVRLSRSDADHFVKHASLWQHVSLMPGLELTLAHDASPAARRAARSICEEYLGG